jgi:dipeptidyl aminopeptidase/acylaminoacyl peptidase
VITETSLKPVTSPGFPPGVVRLEYISSEDDVADWAMAMPGKRDVWIVSLHGATSTGDQIFTRKDIRDLWLAHYLKRGCGVLSPNLRGDAWMCPEAASDLQALLNWTRQKYRVARFIFISGSMGGTGNLIYSILHPEDVSAVVALCPITDIRQFYYDTHPRWLTLKKAYRGTPEQVPERYARHVVVEHADRLRMPLFLSHGDADLVIHVKHSRALYALLKNRGNTEYVEIPVGDHDAPLYEKKMLDWLDRQL